MLEKDIQRDIMQFLELRKWLVVKINNVGIPVEKKGQILRRIPPRKKGVSDIIACSPNGRFVAIEVKRPGQKPTKEQTDFLAEVNNKQGIGIVATSLDDVIAFVRYYEHYGVPKIDKMLRWIGKGSASSIANEMNEKYKK